MIELFMEYHEFQDSSKLIEYESDCFHENLLQILPNLSEEVFKNLTNILEELQAKGKFILSVSPQVIFLNNLFDSI